MAFSLSNWFKGKPGSQDANGEAEKSAAPTPAPVAPKVTARQPVSAVPAVRKVVPNSVQPVSLRDPGARGPVQLTASAPPAPTPAPMSIPAPRATNLMPPRKISFGNPAAVAAAHPVAPEPVAPPVAAPTPMPASVPDVPVSLEVGDFIDRLPPTLLASGPVDRSRQVEFNSSELYSDLTKGRASVPASVIYQKCPDLFSRPVSETEDAEVALPLYKLVEQLTPALQTRADQVAEENVGEIETPFLQVAMEDSMRLPTAAGTTAGAIRPVMPLPVAPAAASELPARPLHRTGQIQAISPLKTPPEPPPMQAAPTAATASPINPGKRPPSTVRASVAGGKIRLSGPSVPNRMAVVPPPSMPVANDLPPSATQRIASPMPPLPSTASPSLQVSKKTQRIQIPPISLRTPGSAPAAPRTPPAPPSVPVQPSPVTVRQNGEPPAPISFRSSPPAPPAPPAVKPMPHSFAPPPRPNFPPPAFPAIPPTMTDLPPAPLPPVPAPAVAPAAPADDRKITLGLAAVLRGLSSSLLAVEPSSVPDDVQLTLPFAPVESQLSTGRVSVRRDLFIEALPEGFRQVLDEGADLPEVPLPLQEVFQNLPSNALSIRADQVEEQVSHHYPTPFSQKAEEDAQRLGVGEVPDAPPAAPAPEPEAALAVDRPLPVDEPATEAAEAAEAKAFAEAPAPIIAEEDPAATARDIPLDLENKAPEPPAEAPVEAKTETPEPVSEPENKVHEEPTPEAEAPAPEPFVPEAKPEVAAAPIPEPTAPVASAEPATAKPAEPAPEAVRKEEPARVPTAISGQDSELQALFMTEEELDAKSVVKHVTALPGLSGCAVMFIDGLRLAGNFPADSETEGFSAMAPPFFKRAKNFATEARIGELRAFTLHTDNGLCSFFMHDDICLSVRHAGRGFLPGVREKLEIVVRELARMYSTAKPAESGQDTSV